jgi:pSer/pThr/pTyr-binding forkhead associated (FHA) protein
LLARRKERGTSQDADVFFHSVNLKRHIALTDKSEQGGF